MLRFLCVMHGFPFFFSYIHTHEIKQWNKERLLIKVKTIWITTSKTANEYFGRFLIGTSDYFIFKSTIHFEASRNLAWDLLSCGSQTMVWNLEEALQYLTYLMYCAYSFLLEIVKSKYRQCRYNILFRNATLIHWKIIPNYQTLLCRML